MAIPDKKISGPIKSQIASKKTAEQCSKRAFRPIGTKFKDRMAAGVGCRHYRDIDIAGSVGSQAGRMVESRGEGALCAIGRVFGDGMFVGQKGISGCVNSQLSGMSRDRD